MAWYDTTGKNADTVISSRVRLARNLAGYPFDGRISREKAQEIVDKVSPLLEKGGFRKIDFRTLSPAEAGAYVEKHYVSRDFAMSKMPRALLLNESLGLAVMIGEEDHLRIQCILPGLDPEKAYEGACRVDDLIDGSFDIAYDDGFGYLTHCPTNLGTGMRASVMMFLPALTMAGEIGKLASKLSKIGLTMRGLYGEGTAASGSIYQISNQITLGITEENTIRKLSDMVKQIEDSEHNLRALITPEKNPKIVDRICRAEGTLRHAFMLSSSELLSLYADVRLGVAIGLIPSVRFDTLDRILVTMMPCSLLCTAKNAGADEKTRDILRAERIRKALSGE